MRPPRSTHIEVSAYADLSFMHADRRAVRSILDNLLSNALRFTPEGGEILLAAEEIKDFVQFTVRDYRPRHRGRTAEYHLRSLQFVLSDKGTGLGLALVRRLVRVAGRANRRGKPPWSWHLPSVSRFRWRLSKLPTILLRWARPMAELKLDRSKEPGKLRIYLGAAPGVGKTYHDAQRRLPQAQAGRRCRHRPCGVARPRRNRRADRRS